MSFIWNLLKAPFAAGDAIRSIPRFAMSLSLPARIAWCVAVFQVLVVILAVAVIFIGDDTQVFAVWRSPGRLVVLAALLLATPVVVYHAARLWLERDVSRFPDILAAWKAGLATLRIQGIDPTQTPLFLVIGADGDDEETRMLEQAPCELTVVAAPAGDAALHVYGGPDAIFVCLASCSRLSDLVRRGDSGPIAAVENPVPPAVDGPQEDPTEIRGTVLVGGLADPPRPPAPASVASPAAAARGGGDAMHTIDISSYAGAATPSPAAGPKKGGQPGRDDMRARLEYLCGLVRRQRAGLAAINGVLAVLPGGRLLAGSVDARMVGQALSDDLATMLATIGVQAPVVTLVLGLEREPGFIELLGRMAAGERSGRLGQRFPPGIIASYEQLGSLAIRACGMVEDLVTGRLFRAAAILSQAGNDHLATLVARLRTELSAKLAVVLRQGLVAAGDETSERAPFVAGCYLAACGEDERERGFLAGVLDRLMDCQGDLEWTTREADTDRAARRTAWALWVVGGVLLAAVALFLAFGR